MRSFTLLKVVATAVLLSTATPLTEAQVRPAMIEASERLVTAGELAIGQGDLDGALMLYEQALVANPANLDAINGLGRIHREMGAADSALRYFRVALEMQPDHLPSLREQALLLIEVGRVDEVGDVLNRIRRICGEAPCPQAREVSAALDDALNDPAPTAEAEVDGTGEDPQ